MDEFITMPPIRISKHLLEMLHALARQEGKSLDELVQNALEVFFSKRNMPCSENAQIVLDLVYKRTGHKPKSTRSTKEVFCELYKEEHL